ncbi:girdin-like isoform X2 [Gigantopelta aegis]|uniref:girdin-like isoform X2 n=1 Tax=Gigantopelta aegis TaxID=1735272 RepID=UPI001B8896AC|nr:girdin-like isoform X2 [Gigantopelta aegis]
MQSSYFDQLPTRMTARSPMRAMHDLPLTFPDSDSGFGSFKTRSRLFNSDDFSMSVPSRLTRSRSLTRLNGSVDEELSPPSSPVMFIPPEKSVRHLRVTLDESENRRSVLMNKLKEAQETLTLQNERLSKIETAAKDNSFLVEDLKFKERDYRKKIAVLQRAEQEKEGLRMENIRLREEMQDRINTLDFQLRSLQSQHQSTEVENEKRSSLLDQTTSTLSLLEMENTKLQKERDLAQDEINVIKEALQLTKSRFGCIDEENKNLKNEYNTMKMENTTLSRKVHEMAGQMVELRTLLQAVRDENERLCGNWKHISEDKQRSSRQIENYQDTIADLKSKLATTSADKDRLFQDRFDLNQKLQQLVLDKEQLIKSKLSLEEQLNNLERTVQHSKMSRSNHNEELNDMEDELNSVKKVCEELSCELSSVKEYYERALERISSLENSSKLLEQQQNITDQEKKRLQAEIDRLERLLCSRNEDDRREREHLEESLSKVKSELKDLRHEKSQLLDRNHELEIKLRKANEELRDIASRQQDEMETWKNTCERLTSSVSWKEAELQNLTDRTCEMESTISKQREELRNSREKYEILAEKQEDVERYRDETRRLLQEKAENEQMIKLLETQKEVLTKSMESSLNKLHDVEHLGGKVDQLRSENELLRDRIQELEEVRDNLIRQKEEMLIDSDLIYKQPNLDDVAQKIDELRDANKQLRDINNIMSEKLEVVEQENFRLKNAMGENVPSHIEEEIERMRRENEQLRSDYDSLKEEHDKLESRHQQFIIQYGHQDEQQRDTEELHKVQQERDALQKQVQLINGQLILVEGSKKRLEETVEDLQKQVHQLTGQIQEADISRCRQAEAEVEQLRKEVDQLQQQLADAESGKAEQDALLDSLKEKSLDDVGEELHKMRGELHDLMGEIESKDQSIMSLENELQKSTEECQFKEKRVHDMKNLIDDLERHNESLKKDLEQTRLSKSLDINFQSESGKHDVYFARTAPSALLPVAVVSNTQNNRSPKSLKDELEEAFKQKKDNTIPRIKPPESLLSKKLLEPKSPQGSSASDPGNFVRKGLFGAQFFFKSQQSEGNERLQTLISKYRSHSQLPATPEKKPNSHTFTSGRLGLGSKSRAFGLTVPKTPDGKVYSSESDTGLSSPRTGHKGPPPPPPPKPKVKFNSSTGTLSRLKDVTDSPSANSSQDHTQASAVDSLMDSQEQRDINALIQKPRLPTKSLLSVHPPKITSTSKYLRCKRGLHK